MALKAKLTPDEHGALDDAFKAEYKESPDKKFFFLDIENFGQHPGAVKLKTTADTLDATVKTLQASETALKAKFGALIEDESFSVDEYERIKAGNKDTPEAIAALQAAQKKQIEMLNAKHADELKKANDTIAERDGYIDNSLIDNGLKDALLDVGVNPDLLDGAVASLKGKLKVNKDAEGNRAAVADTETGEMALTEFVKDWAGGAGKPYLGKASGPGAEGNSSRRKNRAQGNFGGDRSERTDAIKAKFPDLE